LRASNRSGLICGTSKYATGVTDIQLGTVAVVPELGSYAMLLAGLGLLGFMARRRKRKVN
jgi:hypothetical protein